MTIDIYDTINNNIYNFPKKIPYITVSSKGISNGLSTIYNDGADFGPDTYLGATTKNRYGPPYTKTSGLLEAVNYQQKNGGKIQMTAGRFVISSDAPLTQVSSSNVLGYPEYAIIPLSGQAIVNNTVNNVLSFNISGVAGDINSGGTGINNEINVWNNNTTTIIDVSGLSNLPSNASVVLFGYNRMNLPSGTVVSEIINMHDFVIFTAQPTASGENICGGYDFYNSWNANVTNVTVYSPNNFYSTVFPSQYVIGQIIDGEIGNMCWVDNIASYAMYTGFILGSHTHAGTVITQSCYYGLMPFAHHGVDVDRYDTQGCIYPVFTTSSLYGSLRIHSWDGEDYSAAGGNQEVTDVYIPNVSVGYTPYISVDNFHMEYSGGSPNPRFPIISNNAKGYYPVVIKNIEAQAPTISGTTAGTVQPIVLEYSVNTSGSLAGYKKMMFVFSGYENDTTTAQTIPYPSNGAPHNNQLSFVSTPVISANNTGLTISASTTGITITAPNNTIAYNGIVIVEGY